jgi:hypothetical protein
MGLVIGIGHLTLIWMSLRLIFPGDRTKQLWSLLLAGFLPALVYPSHYVTNEALCAALVSLSLYLCLRVLSQERPSWMLCAGLGVSLGLALLTKITAAVALAAVTAGLLWKVTEQRANKRMLWSSLARLLVMCAVCGLVCGWFYVQNRVKFGSWLGFFWIPDSSMNVWRDANYGTFGFYSKFGSVLAEPWFAGRQSLCDGLYSTLWGDGLFGGAVDGGFRPPWNYDLSAVGYWLALLPSFAVLLGFALALRRCWRRPSAEWVVLLSLMFAMMVALIDRSLVTPGFSNAKAFYGLAALLPFCVLGSLGLEALSFRSKLVKTVLSVLFGLWALSSGASFWINRSSEGAVLCKARSLSAEGRYENALQLLKGQLETTPHATKVRCLLTSTLFQLGRDAEGLKEAEQTVQEDPRLVEGRLNLCLALTRHRRIEEALAQAKMAVELAPGNEEGYQKLLGLLIFQKQYDEAVRAGREALAVTPFNPWVRLFLGNALAQGGEEAEAARQLSLAAMLKSEWSAQLPIVVTDKPAVTRENSTSP